jgi:hypothetical protein
MTITAFGSLFLPLILFVFLFRRGWLLPLLVVSVVLQSPAVGVFHWAGASYGITPFLAVSALVALDFAWRWRRGYGSAWPAPGPLRRLLLLWLVFGGVAIAGALALPWAFRGVAVISPLDKAGISAVMSPLLPSINHLAQVVNLALILVSMFWVLQQRNDANLARRLWIGVIAAVLVSVVVGLQQRLGWNGLVPLWDTFWASNPTYDQDYRTWVGVVRRVSWPFVDPTYGSAWYAAVFGGFSAMFLAGMQRNRALLGALLALFALGNSLGGVGLFTLLAWAVLALCAAAWVFLIRPEWRGMLAYRLVLAALVGLCLALAVHLVLRHDGLIGNAGTVLRGTFDNWARHLFGVQRSHADIRAVGLLRDTWGLGVGMGSNRASSYLATLLGNTGVLGAALFLTACAYQLRLLSKVALKGRAIAMFFLGSSVSALITMVVAIPDQNWPVFWILVLGGIACLPQENPSGDAADETTQVAGHAVAGDGACDPTRA